MKKIALQYLFNKKDLKKLHKILDAKDKNALAEFCKEKEKELEGKGVYQKYLYYFLCHELEIN